MADILIDGGFVVTVRGGTTCIIENGLVAIEGQRIIEVGSSKELKTKYKATKTIDARDKLVLPGFINCHTHLNALFRRGLFDDLGECVPYLARTFSWYSLLDEETYYYSALLTCIEMIKSGITTFCECGTTSGMEECSVRAVNEVGMRAVLARQTWDYFGEHSVSGLPENRRETTEQALTRGQEFINRYHHSSDDRILAWLALTQVPNVSDELCRHSKDLVDTYGSGIMTHANVSSAMVQLTRQGFGLPDIERLGQLGILGPNFLAAHAGWVNGRELIMLKESSSSVAHCLSSSMHGAYGSISRGHFPEMVSMGINVALGTDSPASSNSLDMLRQLYLAATAHKEARLDPALFPAGKVLDMATVNGARAVGLGSEIGALEAGKKADIIIFNLLTTGWVPYSKETLLQNLVYAASGESADTCIIDGRILMEGRQLKTVNEKHVLQECQRLFKRFVQKADWLPSD